MKRNQLLITAVCTALVIVLAVFVWNEMQKEPLDLKMYGAEIGADGLVIQETEFSIKGYLKVNKDSFMQPYDIYFKPITFKGILGYSISMEHYQQSDIPVLLHGDADAPNYCAFVYVYDQAKDTFEPVKIYLCHEMCCCLIHADDRYFVGAETPAASVPDILAHFPEIELETTS